MMGLTRLAKPILLMGALRRNLYLNLLRATPIYTLQYHRLISNLQPLTIKVKKDCRDSNFTESFQKVASAFSHEAANLCLV